MAQIGHDLFNYAGMYDNSVERAWRDICAKDKVRNQLAFLMRLRTDSKLAILEVGCGDGSIAYELAKNSVFDSYTGLEISKSGIDAAQKKGIGNANFIYLNPPEVEEFLFKGSVTVFCHVVEHLDNPRQLLIKAHDWSEFLLVEVPLEDNLGMSENYDWDPVGHINKFKTSTIRHLIQTCGWEIESTRLYNPSRKVRTFHSNGLKSNLVWLIKEIAIKINKRVAKHFFTYHYVILAKGPVA